MPQARRVDCPERDVAVAVLFAAGRTVPQVNRNADASAERRVGLNEPHAQLIGDGQTLLPGERRVNAAEPEKLNLAAGH
jgi:hypothetical protein